MTANFFAVLVGLLVFLSTAADAGADQLLLAETRALAESGDAWAQHKLALMYDLGVGVRENNAEAAKWYTEAAEQGHAYAQYNIGLMYYKGEGVPHNEAQALKRWRLAADQGIAGICT